MRLTCPNCDAQYEVPDEVIPEGGRDVQCSNCEQTWFQDKTESTPAKPATPVQSESPPAEAAPTEPKRKEVQEEPKAPVQDSPTSVEEPTETGSTGNIDPAVADILKQEAAREAELRAMESTSLESQPDLALDPPETPKARPKRPTTTQTAANAGAKEALPDIDSINSSLRSDAAVDEAEVAPAAQRKSGGFLRGFGLIIIIGIVLFLIYGNADQISEAVPQADPALKSYVSLIDQARIWLETQLGNAAQN